MRGQEACGGYLAAIRIVNAPTVPPGPDARAGDGKRSQR
jgi:hypothetical protein